VDETTAYCVRRNTDRDGGRMLSSQRSRNNDHTEDLHPFSSRSMEISGGRSTGTPSWLISIRVSAVGPLNTDTHLDCEDTYTRSTDMRRAIRASIISKGPVIGSIPLLLLCTPTWNSCLHDSIVVYNFCMLLMLLSSLASQPHSVPQRRSLSVESRYVQTLLMRNKLRSLPLRCGFTLS